MNRSRPQDNSHSSNAIISQRRKTSQQSRQTSSQPVRVFRLVYLRLLRLRGKPHAIATGLAVGVFAGFFPFLGFQTVIGIFLAAILGGSKVAAAAATWISNPVTYLPIYIFNFKVGKFLLGIEEQFKLPLKLEDLVSLKEMGFKFAVILLTGCCLVGFVAGVITYFSSLMLLNRIKAKRNILKRKKLTRRTKNYS